MAKRQGSLTSPSKKWRRKVLYSLEFYDGNAYPSAEDDAINYPHIVDPATVRYDFRHVVFHACSVSQHVNCTLLYAATLLAYADTRRSDWLNFYWTSPQALAMETALVTTLLLCACARIFVGRSHDHPSNRRFTKLPNGQGDQKDFPQPFSKKGVRWRMFLGEFWRTFRSFAIFTAFNFALSPILASLTQSVSTDSIYALASSSFVLNAFLQDYHYPFIQNGPRQHSQSQANDMKGDQCTQKLDREIDPKDRISKMSLTRLSPPAFNSALFGSICLASRLPASPYHAFTATSLSALVFGLWPDLRSLLKVTMARPKPWQELFTLFLTCLTCTSIYALTTEFNGSARALAVLALVMNVVITLIVPAIFVRMQVYKNVIRGPWDEAVIPPS